MFVETSLDILNRSLLIEKDLSNENCSSELNGIQTLNCLVDVGNRRLLEKAVRSDFKFERSTIRLTLIK